MQEPASTATPGAEAPVTLAEGVRRNAALRPDQPALISPDGTVTWAELDGWVDRVAAGLRELVGEPSAASPAPGPGQPCPARIALALTNSPEFAVALLATVRAGLVAVPVNPGLAAPELHHVLADSGASRLLCTPAVRDAVAGVAGGLPALAGVHTALPTGTADLSALPRPDDEDLAVLLYTSGTEGRPKGAMLTHRALRANHEQLGRIEPPVVGPGDVLLLAVPLFHAYGLNTGLGAVVHHGACGVLVERFDAAAALATIARHRVTAVIGVPPMFLAWSALPDLAQGMASVRLAVCGAAPLEPAVAARFAELTGGPVWIGYGLTETAPVLTSTLAGGRAKPGSIGVPLPGVRLRLVDGAGEVRWEAGPPDEGHAGSTVGGHAGSTAGGHADDDDEFDLDLVGPVTDPGQILVRGANLFSGYWPDGRDGPDPDGWWATGDVAYADEDGDLFLVDRLGELILVNGFNVYPREVELVLDAHPEVVESAVLGVPHPRAGQAVLAYAVRAPGSGLTEEALRAYCERHLARFKCPAEVRFVDALPHSAIGKVRKTLLRSAPAAPGALPKARRPHDQ
ncbi:AMP-binding protein [Micromonospora sp. NPDC049559]|uniref:AMP-binding protein n=1 Tax=Micromonospora sp. NPDC049559 TaxID=3155923 RepID=UPI00343A856A